MNIVFSKEVESALKHKRPVVALESTIITQWNALSKKHWNGT